MNRRPTSCYVCKVSITHGEAWECVACGRAVHGRCCSGIAIPRTRSGHVGGTCKACDPVAKAAAPTR